MTHALVRTISRSLASCELLHLPRRAFDLSRAARQHEDYVKALSDAGASVRILPEAPEFPDATFVEDPVVILDELAIIGRMGNASRAAETALLLPEIESFRKCFRIEKPGTLEGGDIMRMGRTLFIGQSTRTNPEGIAQVQRIVAPFGYRTVTVKVDGCLHFKTGITSPADGVVVANPAWIDLSAFRDLEIISVVRDEPWGANTLSVNDRVLVAASAPGTAKALRQRGLDVHCVDISELQKAEAGLTCLSVLYAAGETTPV